MKHILILALLIFFSRETLAFSKTAAELYADLLRMENDGRLPEYIKETRSLFKEAPSVSDGGQETSLTHMQRVLEYEKSVKLDKERLLLKSEGKTWDELAASVAGGVPGAFDVEEIKKLADARFPDAVEMLAWMYAKGVGVRKNLKSAWFLYMKAADLEVEGALDNARIIYGSMSEEDKRNLLGY